jgi:anti-sigma B factor antagonist
MGTEAEPEAAPPLEITTETTGPNPTIRVSGELDLSSCRQLQAALRAVESSQPAAIVLDLRNITFLDSTGLKLLLAEQANAQTQNRRLLIVRPLGPADRIFRLTLLEDRFEFVEAPAAEG